MNRIMNFNLFLSSSLRLVFSGTLALAAFFASVASAQEDDPFQLGAEPMAEDAPLDEADEAAADEPAAEDPIDEEPAAAPAAAPAPAPGATEPPPADAPTLADFARRDPAIAAVLDLPRETPLQKLC